MGGWSYAIPSVLFEARPSFREPLVQERNRKGSILRSHHVNCHVSFFKEDEGAGGGLKPVNVEVR